MVAASLLLEKMFPEEDADTTLENLKTLMALEGEYTQMVSKRLIDRVFKLNAFVKDFEFFHEVLQFFARHSLQALMQSQLWDNDALMNNPVGLNSPTYIIYLISSVQKHCHNIV